MIVLDALLVVFDVDDDDLAASRRLCSIKLVSGRWGDMRSLLVENEATTL